MISTNWILSANRLYTNNRFHLESQNDAQIRLHYKMATAVTTFLMTIISSLCLFFPAHRRHPYKLGMMLKHLHTVICALAFVHRTRNVAEKPISYILFCCFIWMRNRLPRPTVCNPVKVGAIIIAAKAIAIATQTATAAIITQTNAKLTGTFPDTK